MIMFDMCVVTARGKSAQNVRREERIRESHKVHAANPIRGELQRGCEVRSQGVCPSESAGQCTGAILLRVDAARSVSRYV